MKKHLTISYIFAFILIFLFIFFLFVTKNFLKYDDIKVDNSIAIFSSNTCFKKTYYINKDNVNMYDKNTNGKKVIFTLNKEDVVVAYKDKNGYIYCEESKKGIKGWIKKSKKDLKGFLYKKTKYKVDIDLINQEMKVFKNSNLVRKMKCSTGIFGDKETETPVGIFYTQVKGKYFYSNKYNEGGKYYIKFFSDYLIHSVPVDRKGNIIKEEEDKLGIASSHGCVRISMEDAKWLYNNMPEGTLVFIHY